MNLNSEVLEKQVKIDRKAGFLVFAARMNWYIIKCSGCGLRSRDADINTLRHLYRNGCPACHELSGFQVIGEPHPALPTHYLGESEEEWARG